MAVRHPSTVERNRDGIDLDDSPIMFGGELSADPAPYSNRVQVYAKRDEDGYLDLYTCDEYARVTQLTAAGTVPLLANSQEGMRLHQVEGHETADDGPLVNILIGTTEEQDIDPGEDFKYPLQIERTHNQSTYMLIINRADGNHSVAGMVFQSDVASLSLGTFSQSSVFGDMRLAGESFILEYQGPGLCIMTGGNEYIRFGVANTEVARFANPSGALLINTTSLLGTEKFRVVGQSELEATTINGTFRCLEGAFTVDEAGLFTVVKTNIRINEDGDIQGKDENSILYTNNLQLHSSAAEMILDSVSVAMNLKGAGQQRIKLDATGIGFFAAPAVVQQTVGAVTNSVTSGGADGTIADYNIVDYATDAAAIRNDIYQLARSLAQLSVMARNYGLGA